MKTFSDVGEIPANDLQLTISLAMDPCKVSEAKQHFILFSSSVEKEKVK